MKKRMTSLFLALALCLGLLPVTALAAGEDAPANLYVGNQHVFVAETVTYWTTDESGELKLGTNAGEKEDGADADKAYEEAKETVMGELRRTFRPEFLNRIDDIIVFRALTEQDIEEVARRMLKTVADRMESMGIHLEASDEAVKELAREGFDPQYGARPLRRAIQSKVEDAVAEKMLDGTLKTGDTAKLAVEDGKLVVS